ncbi:esterase/lipase family protein, partial [Streptomyces mirabilis]
MLVIEYGFANVAPPHNRPILRGNTLNAGALGVVFVHGITSSAATWNDVRASLAQTEDLADLEPQPPFEYATGLFGNKPLSLKKPLSLSGALRVLPSLDTVADSLVAYLDTEAADFQRLVLVGHSMGGLVIQRFLARMLARRRGTDLARIRRIVLLACP